MIALLAGCAASRTADRGALPECEPGADVSTATWERVDAGSFSFRIPPGYANVPVQGTDSQVGIYRRASGGAEVSYDLGMYSNDLTQDAQYVEYAACSEVIGGRRATVVRGVLGNPSEEGGRFVAAATWRNLRSGSMPLHLTMFNTARDSSELALLNAVLRSVQFDL